ncbi:shikimate dehydrogenase [Campylobacter majalis]|uniref:shikimate dehydrogenase n=1 Tax=Campylobacter majalis TaxID=2790656 RepID=UPI003D696D65
MKYFAVIGDPVSHSISPILHNMAIFELGLDAVYTRYHLKKSSEIVNAFISLGLSGANVTIPHKEFALALCDEASSMAKNIGSANTLVFKNNKIYAYNTDGLGFLKSISDFSEIKSALVIGAGGTAKAIAYILKQNFIDVEILNRSLDRLEGFKQAYECYTWNDFLPKNYDLVINTTSAGLRDDLLPAPIEILTPIISSSRYAFDVIYGKTTPFLHLAIQNNLVCKDGLDMLLHQAVLAFNLFFDNDLDEYEIQKAMQKALRLL